MPNEPDPRFVALAQAFLEPHPGLADEVTALAEYLQEHAEDWLEQEGEGDGDAAA